VFIDIIDIYHYESNIKFYDLYKPISHNYRMDTQQTNKPLSQERFVTDNIQLRSPEFQSYQVYILCMFTAIILI